MRRLFKLFFFTCLFLTSELLTQNSQAQEAYKWITPSSVNVHGRVSSTVDGYNRFPGKMHGLVREAVWRLSNNSAGLYLDFQTTSTSFVVRYRVKGRLSMPHMATTGVSGVDLYAFNGQTWGWANGSYQFKDTITYTFENLTPPGNSKRTYRLYLPLYNTVEWLEIGIPKSETLRFLSNRKEPIIVYGTSIAQGACASRPGLAWTNILNRSLNIPTVNLGFSGNGRLEKPVLDLIARTPAKIIILDCLPNLGLIEGRNEGQLDSIIYDAVTLIRQHQPETPIILTEHSSGFNSDILNSSKLRSYEQSTNVARGTYSRLQAEGVVNLYLLSNEEIGLDINSTVDYAHPNDLGMMKIAHAYGRIIEKIENRAKNKKRKPGVTKAK